MSIEIGELVQLMKEQEEYYSKLGAKGDVIETAHKRHLLILLDKLVRRAV